MTPKSRTILYVRCSTAEQTSAHQITQAREAGFIFDDSDVVTDHGVSGVSTALRDREGGRRLFDMLRPGDTLLVRWVNRLGRSYYDVKEVIETLIKKGITVKTVINHMVFEPDHALGHDRMRMAARDAILTFMVAIADAEEVARKEARRAGIAHVKASADADHKYRGKKPSYTRAQHTDVVRALSGPAPMIAAIARDTGLTRQTVLRIKADPVGTEAALARWGI